MKIARIVFDIDMRCNFEGLREYLKKEVELETLSKDYVVICFNRRKTCFKMLIDNNYIVYYKHKTRIPLEAIQFLPQRFGGSEMEFNRAVETSLRQKLNLAPPKEKKVTVSKRVVRRPSAEARA